MHEQGQDVGVRGDAFYPSDCSPLSGEPATSKSEPDSPLCASSQTKNLGEDDALSGETRNSQKGCKISEPKPEKRYLGVRVRMPVRDMLRRIRIAKGVDPAALQGTTGKTSKGSGEKKRVPSSGDRRSRANKKQIKSLEDLAIIVEVLEEDLKASRRRCPERAFSAAIFSGWEEDFRGEDFPCQNQMFKHSHRSSPAVMQESPTPSEVSPTSPTNQAWSFSPNPMNTEDMVPSPTVWGSLYSDDSEERFPSPQPAMALPNSHAKWLGPSPPDSSPNSPQDLRRERLQDQGVFPTSWASQLASDWDGMSFFLFQLQKQESLLRGVPEKELLATDDKGRTLLHSAVTEGKRALAHVIARRMAAVNQLDIRDSGGKTALHLSAQRNQHLMVADLLFFGANVNLRDKSGKTCLHLSAENGYVRVLEVLRQAVHNGMYLDIEARDANGMSALQCALNALDANTRALGGSVAPSQMRLHMLCREQLLDSLECMLHMGAGWRGPGPAQSYALADHEGQLARSSVWVRPTEGALL
ncbi:NF-kappa-B inhibitor zeta isoform X2 [Brienomyrus brachyistius]|uniref:NF-kappa-B inhibitor zeta isoform X2 n=1 Tax=Brienomyrus brachyistius TaxID=42636 RepID=UPI0020B191CB|nr:NF-kappa-B inhibitor zeta isoform X2 [Brienomyrus brachyistius]